MFLVAVKPQCRPVSGVAHRHRSRGPFFRPATANASQPVTVDDFELLAQVAEIESCLRVGATALGRGLVVRSAGGVASAGPVLSAPLYNALVISDEALEGE